MRYITREIFLDKDEAIELPKGFVILRVYPAGFGKVHGIVYLEPVKEARNGNINKV